MHLLPTIYTNSSSSSSINNALLAAVVAAAWWFQAGSYAIESLLGGTPSRHEYGPRRGDRPPL